MQSIASHNNYLVFLFCPQTKKAANLCDLLLLSVGMRRVTQPCFLKRKPCVYRSPRISFFTKNSENSPTLFIIIVESGLCS